MDIKQPFEQIVAEHEAVVLRVCRAVLGPHPDAEDAWSETFLAALRAWPYLPAGANVQAWLVTIAHRKAIDIIRARKRAPSPVDEVPDSTSAHGRPEGGDPELWAAVKTLPDKQRQAVAYRYLGGLAHQDIAEILGGTTEAARKASSDGIRTLRARFTREHSEGAPR